MRPVQVKELLIIGTIAKRMGSMDGGHGCHACHYVGGVTFGGSLLQTDSRLPTPAHRLYTNLLERQPVIS